MNEERIIENFNGKKICVIGDIILDIYILGRPYRLSREAPVVVVKHEEERVYPGSAGNTINNLRTLGAHVYPLSFLGNDEAGNRLVEFFSTYENVEVKGLIRCDNETVTKTRILAGDTHTSKQQVIRIDKDRWKQVSERERGLFEKTLREYMPYMDAFIVSDYGHGTVDEKTIKSMRRIAKEKIVVGDSRYNLKAFKGFTIITPNESEAYLLSSMKDGSPVEEVGKKIMGFMDLAALLITRGNKGMTLFTKDGNIHHIPISGTDDVTDVTGAGDTVCAALTLSLAAGADFLTASMIANYAAGVVVMKRGTATVNTDELKAAIKGHRGIDRIKEHG